MATKSTIGIYFKSWGKGEKVVLIHGSNTAFPESTWFQQATLAQHYQLLIPHRRGYGASPLIQSEGFEDNVQDILYLLENGAHLVGSSYGGIIALLVAAKEPGLVKSLAIIEPPAFAVVRNHPDVEKVIERISPLYAATPKLTPQKFIEEFTVALGGHFNKSLQLSPEYRKAIVATMNEPPPWEAQIPINTLSTTTFPKLVVSGGWHSAFETVANFLAQHLGMKRAIIQGAGHEVQKIGKPFNDLLKTLWQFCGSDLHLTDPNKLAENLKSDY